MSDDQRDNRAAHDPARMFTMSGFDYLQKMLAGHVPKELTPRR